MLVLAHRGNHSRCPENTNEAFEQAIRDGADGIETDVRLTRDGALVLFHDRTLADGRVVAELTHSELSAASGFAVPTLDAALATHDVLWNIELKAASALDPLLEVVSRYRDRRRCFVTSFLHPVIAEIAQRADVDCGVLIAHAPCNVGHLVESIRGMGATRLVVDYETLAPTLVREARAAGLEVLAYGVRGQKEVQSCAREGLSGVITDFVIEALSAR